MESLIWRGLVGFVTDIAHSRRESAAQKRIAELARLRRQFEADEALYDEAHVQEALEAVLAVRGFVRSTKEGKFFGASRGAPPVWTPGEFDPEHPVFFALARWNRHFNHAAGLVSDYAPVEVWREVKIIPDAKNRTIGVYAGRDKILAEEQWSSRRILEQHLKTARNYPARMATLSLDYFIRGRQSLEPTWSGIKF